MKAFLRSIRRFVKWTYQEYVKAISGEASQDGTNKQVQKSENKAKFTKDFLSLASKGRQITEQEVDIITGFFNFVLSPKYAPGRRSEPSA